MTDQDTTATEDEAVLAQRAIEAYESARDRAADTLGEVPLLALAGGIAAGALIAALASRAPKPRPAQSVRRHGASRTRLARP